MIQIYKIMSLAQKQFGKSIFTHNVKLSCFNFKILFLNILANKNRFAITRLKANQVYARKSFLNTI